MTKPQAAEPFEAVDITAELAARTVRAADCKGEADALSTLARHLAPMPRDLWQVLADQARLLCRADALAVFAFAVDRETDGVSCRVLALEPPSSPRPTDFELACPPVDGGATMLFAHPGESYRPAAGLAPMRESLMATWQIAGRGAGGLWAFTHDAGRFDGEDARLLTSLARFAAAAWQTASNEEALRRSEARQAYLVRLSDALRRLDDAREIEDVATRMLGEHLGATRVFCAESIGESGVGVVLREYARGGAPGITGRYQLEEFPSAMAEVSSGRTFVVSNVNTSPLLSAAERLRLRALGSQAHIIVPFRRGGTLRGVLAVSHDEPREWTGVDLATIQDTADRMWEVVQRARTQAALRDSEARLRLLVESVQDYAIITFDTAGRIVSWNTGASRVFGYPPAEALTHGIGLIFTPEDRAAGVPEEEMRHARETDRAEDERWHLHRDGRRLFVSGITAPLRDEGAVTGYVKIARDLTERKRLDDALRQAHYEAQQANRSKDQFLAMLGHELRNPLAPMVTALEVMRIKGLSSPEQEILSRQVGHLTRMVDELLDVSRVTGGKIELRRRPIELREIVDRAMELAGPTLAQRDNRVELQMPWRGLGVDADRDRMAQVLANLLVNASKYSDRGSPIVLHGERAGALVRVAVVDQGIGIPLDMLEHVFEPFVQQPQSLDRSQGGLGLGLAIVRSLVQAHGGQVRARPNDRQPGTTFEIELPAVEVPARVGESRPHDPPARVRHSARRILIVDDNADAADTLRRALEALGYTVDVAGDGPSALDHAQAFAPTVVLLDIGLPLMDGYEVAQQMRAMWEGRHVLVVAVTGYGQATDRARAQECGFDHFLVKPVTIRQLLELIEGE